MCDPTAIAVGSLILSAGSAVAGHAAQASDKKKNDEAAIKAMKDMWTDVGLLQQETMQGGAVTVLEADRQARMAKATALTAAGEANVSGISVDALLADLARQGAEFRTQATRQTDRQVQQLQREKESGRTVAQNRMAAVSGPNPFVTGLRIGGAVMDYASFRSTQTPD